MFLIWLLIGLAMFRCDPGESLKYSIDNNTSLDIKIYFVSRFIYPDLTDNARVKVISSMNSYIDISGSTPGLGQAVFSFVEHDSIYITDASDKILKVLKKKLR